MVISRTPFRTSFFGGGTDYPAWYLENGGAVLSAAINKYCYITVRRLPPFFRHKHRIIYSEIENVINIEDIRHPAVRAVFGFMNVNKGIEMHHDGDLPARTGLGSSSSFTVGLLNSLYAMEGASISRERLAKEAIHIEQKILRENVGSQDQVQVAYGGLNMIRFGRDGNFKVEPLPVSRERKEALENHLLLFFSGFSRYSSDIASKQIANVKKKQKELFEMRSMVDHGAKILTGNGDISDFGYLLHESWLLKRTLSESVSTPQIDSIYGAAREAGALGGKLIGAGGGGFILLFVPPELHASVKERLKDLVCVPVGFESDGSRIIFNNGG
jgi:D-glycero-alpha-D-manno-heptose-7-phosphate kinase